MSLSRVVGVLALVAQVGNVSQAFFLNLLSPDHALLVSAILAGIQAFTGRVQGVKDEEF